MCQGGFLESSTKRIELKEDDPEVFSIVLTYLYRGDYEPLFPLGSVPVCKIRSPENLKSRRDKHAMESALVYIMADKYQIEELKIAAVQKLKNLQPLSFQAFLALSLQVYRSLPESDLHFRGFFAKVAPCQLTGAAEDIIRPYIKEGGLLAEDMLFALRTSIIAPAFAKSSIVR